MRKRLLLIGTACCMAIALVCFAATQAWETGGGPALTTVSRDEMSNVEKSPSVNSALARSSQGVIFLSAVLPEGAVLASDLPSEPDSTEPVDETDVTPSTDTATDPTETLPEEVPEASALPTDPVSVQNTATGSGGLTLAISTGDDILVCVNAQGVGSFAGKTFVISYDPAVLELLDVAAQTAAGTISPGAVPQTSLTIETVGTGSVTFSLDKEVPTGFAWSGMMTVLRFRALTAGETQVTLAGIPDNAALAQTENTTLPAASTDPTESPEVTEPTELPELPDTPEIPEVPDAEDPSATIPAA